MEDLAKVYITKYREQLVPITLLVVSTLVILRVIMAQLSTVSSVRSQIEEKKNSISDFRASLTTLQSLRQEDLANDLGIASRALPNAKEILDIFSSLTSTAYRANVLLTSFSLKVGGVYSKNKPVLENRASSGIPALNITLQIQAPTKDNILRFSKELYKTLPLAEVKKLSAGDGNGSFEILSYYKPNDLAQIARQQTISPLNALEQATLNEINSWK